jgi:hypothetical protein
MNNYKYTTFMKVNDVTIPDWARIDYSDIVEYEKKWSIKFPLAYKELLLICGKLRGSNFFRSNYYIDTYPELWSSVKEIIKENNSSFHFSKEIYIFSEFLEHGKFWFFRLDEGDNPPIYSYTFDLEILKKEYDSLTDCILAQQW